MTCPMMMSLGVYVLGAADNAERRRLEAHLPGCQECQMELRRLAPLPGLLAGLPESFRDATPSPVRPAGQPRRAPMHGRARRRWAAAAAACLAAGVSGGLWLLGAAGSQATALTLTGTNPATHVTATATLTATSWGSSIQLQVSELPENVECRLIVRSRNGGSEVSGAWDAWQKGPVSIPASASWLPSDIASLQVTTSAESLVTMREKQ
jgi:predicted anti-sigma-YlaC factor YlaD